MIVVKDLVKNFKNGDVVTRVLRGIDFVVEDGEFVAIMGRSGAGKSTFMYQMSLLDVPTSGSVQINDVHTSQLSRKERTDFRLKKLGYVFQEYALIPDLSAIENVMIPLLMRGDSKQEAKDKAQKTLEVINLGERLDNRPSQLSGGEQQRVAIARAVAPEPSVLFADEPTANLDSVSGNRVIEEIERLHARGQTVVMVTHEYEYARYANRIVHLEDGVIVREEEGEKGTHKNIK